MGVQIGVLTADRERTLKRYPDVNCFDTRRGRLVAMIRATLWSDIVVVGGGELVQDQSSLLYSPYNLLPLFLAALFGKKSFAWAVGIGQRKELTAFTRLLTSLAMKTVSGITVRDRGSFNVLHSLGVREPKMILASDTALTLSEKNTEVKRFLGAAPRDVSNRTRHLLPLEIRKKLGMHKPKDPGRAASRWAKLLDWYSKKFGEKVVLFPFHTGTLSNDDGTFCRLVKKRMKTGEQVHIADLENTEEFLGLLRGCRIMVTTPLHGAVMAFAYGVLPVSISYSSKCTRFMEQAGLADYVAADGPGLPGKTSALALKKARENSESMEEDMSPRRKELVQRALLTPEHFRKTFNL